MVDNANFASNEKDQRNPENFDFQTLCLQDSLILLNNFVCCGYQSVAIDFILLRIVDFAAPASVLCRHSSFLGSL